MKKEMLINVLQPEEIRIAVIEDGVLEELYVERTSHESYVGNIYKGRIVNIEPSIQAAFVDFGVGRNGFLHVSDVEPAYYRHLEQGQSPRGGRDEGRGEERGTRGEGRGRRGEERSRRGGRDRDEGRTRPRSFAEAFDEGELAEQAEHETERARELAPEEIFERVELDESELEAFEEPAAAETCTAPEAAEADQTDSVARVWDDVTIPEASALTAPALEAPQTETNDAVASTPETEAPPAAESEEAEEKKKPKRRARGGRTRRKTTRKSESEEAAPEAEKEADSDDDRPRLMDSSERRTEPGDDPLGPSLPQPDDDVSDEELSFSMARREPAPLRNEVRHEPAALTADEEDEPDAEDFEDTEVMCEAAHGSLDPLAASGPEPDEEQQEIAEIDRMQADLDDEVSARQGAVDFEDAESGAFDEYESRGERSRRDDRRGGSRGDRGDRGGPRRGGPRRGGRPGMGRPKPLIQDIFKRGQEVLVQVIKEGIGTKGPTLSTYISIAGRYLVLMPGLNRIGVSRKIIDEESRRRLREIMGDLQPPKGLGFIIRTAGEDRNRKELQKDLAYLARLWQVVVRRIRKQKSPCEIYQESDMVTRTIRDIFSGDIDTIWVDEPGAYEHAKEFLQVVMPRYADRIKLWDSTEPMFHKHGIEQEIVRIQQRKVPLSQGGSIVIEQTEALVAIDVNSGNFRADNNAEETAYQMNLHAAKEIARQLRLRDLGGVIVNDFIDMREEKHRRGVERALREAVRRDRARTKILKISQFGIIEMTRQRIRPSLKRSVCHDCGHCHGTGQVKTVESMSIEVMRLLQLAAHRNHMQRIEVRVHDEVAQYLLNRKRKEIAHLEEQSEKPILVRGVTGVSPEHLEFLCYDNHDNEVRFTAFEEPRSAPRRRGHHRDR